MKVTINGEVFGFDPKRQPMSEALAIENALKIPYVQYEQDLEKGSALSLAGFIWLVWRRNGREVPWADIVSGAVEIDMSTLEVDNEEGEAGEADPTAPAPAASSSTGESTSASSPKSSTSARGSSAS